MPTKTELCEDIPRVVHLLSTTFFTFFHFSQVVIPCHVVSWQLMNCAHPAQNVSFSQRSDVAKSGLCQPFYLLTRWIRLSKKWAAHRARCRGFHPRPSIFLAYRQLHGMHQPRFLAEIPRKCRSFLPPSRAWGGAAHLLTERCENVAWRTLVPQVLAAPFTPVYPPLVYPVCIQKGAKTWQKCRVR